MRCGYDKPVISVLWGLLFLLVTNAAFGDTATRKHTKAYKRALVANKILLEHPKFAEATIYACINAYYRQGLPFSQIMALCGTQLQIDEGKGFGGGLGSISGGFGRGQSAFDPGQVSAACATGDPRKGQGKDPAPYSGQRPWSHFSENRTDYKVVGGTRLELYGSYSWGGKGKLYDDYGRRVTNDQGQNMVALGLTREQAEKIKAERVKAAKTAWDDFNKKCGEGSSTPADECAKLRKKAQDADAEAEDDPNTEPEGSSMPAAGLESACDMAVASAREVLRECNRNGWKSAQCQQLSAKMNHCPDPTYIYIDPEQGYECGAKVDPQLVVQAAVERCRKTTRPYPDGRDPCKPPQVSDSGRVIYGASKDICSDPKAYVDPASNACIVEIQADTFGRPDLASIILFALNKFGGPIVVLPRRNPPPPRPGPQPEPGPRPR